jgi:hypothetical protein
LLIQVLAHPRVEPALIWWLCHRSLAAVAFRPPSSLLPIHPKLLASSTALFSAHSSSLIVNTNVQVCQVTSITLFKTKGDICIGLIGAKVLTFVLGGRLAGSSSTGASRAFLCTQQQLDCEHKRASLLGHINHIIQDKG